MAQITYRNLDYWTRCNFIDLDPEHVGSPTPGSGQPRRFTAREASRFKLLAAFVRAGLRVSVAADIVRKMERNASAPMSVPLSSEGIWITVDARYAF